MNPENIVPTRRRFLSMLGIAAPAAALTSVPAIALARAAVRPAAVRDEALLALGADLAPQRAAHAAAAATFAAACRQLAETIGQAVPAELIDCSSYDWAIRHCAIEERDYNGDAITTEGDRRSRRILHSQPLQRLTKPGHVASDGHTAVGKLVRRLIRIAKAHEDAALRAAEAAGIDALRETAYDARHAVTATLLAMAETRPATMEGLRLKAATSASVDADRGPQGLECHYEALQLRASLVDDILALASGLAPAMAA